MHSRHPSNMIRLTPISAPITSECMNCITRLLIVITTKTIKERMTQICKVGLEPSSLQHLPILAGQELRDFRPFSAVQEGLLYGPLAPVAMEPTNGQRYSLVRCNKELFWGLKMKLLVYWAGQE